MTKRIKKTVIFAGYSCNNNCRFCINWDKRTIPDRSTLEIKREIVGAKNRGSTYLEIIGGEPTIRKDILKLVSFAKEMGFKTIMMSTNGRVYSYKGFAEKMLSAGLNSIVFSIHGHTAKLHDSLTQSPGSYSQMKKGIENVREAAGKLGLKISIGSNTCIVKQNYKYLPQVGRYIQSLGIDNAEFIFVDPNYGAAFRFFDKLVPRISEIAPYVQKCLDIGKKSKAGHWHIRYVPLCYFQDYLGQISELEEVKTFQTEHVAPDFYNPDAEKGRATIGRAKTEKCRGCKLYNICEGIWKEYLRHYGDGELQPIKKNNSRGLVYIPEFGKYSRYASELICLKHDIRKIVQIDLSPREKSLNLRRIITKTGLGIISRNLKFDKRIIRHFIFNPQKIGKMKKNLENELNCEKIGELMGYPSCCVKAYIKTTIANRDISNCMSIKRDEYFNFSVNPFVKFIHNAYPISHFPCSLHCKRSIELARRIYKTIKKECPSLYKKMYELSCYPILFFPRSKAKYDLAEGVNFVMFKGKLINKNKIIYNNILATSFKKTSLPRISYYANSILMGNNILITKEGFSVFSDNKFIHKFSRKEDKFYFLFPY